MLIKKPNEIKESRVTPESVYLNRRQILAAGALSAAGTIAGGLLPKSAFAGQSPAPMGPELQGVVKSPLSTDETPNTWEQLTTYNNFYEFGVGKDDPARYAGALTVEPWSVKVDGKVGKPGDYAIDDLIKPNTLEERIYRHRCVEAWSAIIPWVGVPLRDVLQRLEPEPSAKFVAFESLARPSEMPGLRYPVLDWPYREGLRMDEAMHPLTLLCVGLYGRELPNQNGAPIRLVVPWKYGFKGIKSIVRISLVEDQPRTAWNRQNPNEYGFYSNVNPNVDHPRWSQATERPLGGYFRKETLMFNGYDEVAGLYEGMDLKRYY
ncbi:MAG: protein-methionine-sulfoxide reductase catalytic subunit MsrP [Acidobacteriota bacterium]|jgi:sulfoxide reductase catalytic subunit YedY